MKYKITGNWADQVISQLRGSIEDAMVEAGKKEQEIIESHFDSFQSQWLPLKTYTVAQRRKQGYNGPTPILERSKVLRENVATQHQIIIGGHNVTLIVSPGSAKTNYSDENIQDYAAALDAQRPFYAISDQDQTEFNKFLVEEIAKQWRDRH